MSIRLPNPSQITTTNKLSLKIKDKITEISRVVDDLPGIVIVHDMRDLSVVYMSPRGTEILGVSLEEIIQMGPDYHTAFFNAEESQEYVPQIMDFLERNNNTESLSIFQQVKGRHEQSWTWYASTMKTLMWNDSGKPLLTITIALPIDTNHHISIKVGRLLDENNFLRKHYHQFSKLSKREQQVLKLLAMGKSAADIAVELFISTTTAETHRRNIRQKLEVDSAYELSQYARAFNLI